MKQFKFEDDSSLDLCFNEEGNLEIVLQAQHIGSGKITSASVVLSQEKVNELVNWLGEQLLPGVS